ncbi:MAG TPA: protein kinase [Bacteroidota bacterium]|nr:protein kinase [Bacteroidota bacterium]
MIGSVISHYKILEKLGEGGMGVVYKAQDTKLDRIVALKFLPVALTSDPTERERFHQEAKAASQLMHPNVTAIFEINESEGQIYLAMEHVDGSTLKTIILKEEPLSTRKALDLAIQLCSGLSAAHEKGIVHRDIKSENILVNTKGELKITDFGLAKLKGASKLTKTGSTLGTAAYMSPEQAQGDDVDARSDIFSAGVVLYELLTGKLPFRGEHQAAILYSLINEEPLPLTRFDEKITPEIQRIVSKALAKDREDRYQHADEMLADLKRERKAMEYARTGYITQQFTASSSDKAAESGSPTPPGRLKNMILISAGVVIVLLAVRIYLFLERMTKGDSTGRLTVSKIAVLPFENFGPADREYFADGLTDEIRTKLSGLSGLAVIARASSVQYKKTTKPVADIGNELSVGYLLQGTIRWEEGDSSHRSTERLLVNPTLVKVADGTQVWSQSFEGTLSSVFEIQSDIAQQVTHALEVVLNPADKKTIEARPTDNAEAYDYFLRGQQVFSVRTPENLKQAIDLFRKAVEHDPKFVEAYEYMCRTYSFIIFLGQGSDSLMLLSKNSLNEVLDLAPNSFHAYLTEGYYCYYALRNYDQAIKYFTDAFQLQPNNAEVISSIGYVKRRQGKFPEALTLLSRGSELDPQDWDKWIELAFLELAMRNYSSSDEHFRRAFLIRGKGSTPYAAMHAIAVLSMSGNLDTAFELFRKESDDTDSWTYRERSYSFHVAKGDFRAASLDLDRSVLTEPDINQVSFYSAMGYLLDKSSRHTEARACYDTARVFAENAVKTYPTDWSTHSGLGMALAHLGESARAIEEGRKAVELMPLEKDALNGGPDAIYALAQIYAVVGENNLAIDKLEQILNIPDIYSVSYIQFDPDLATLRNQPRFQSLMEKFKSPQM